MKYIFIANPNAGNKDAVSRVENEINSLKTKIDYEIYVTQCKQDGTQFVREYCKKNQDEKACFVACGGDGTINEVAHGLVGSKNKTLAILAFGSGNDFIKYYKGKCFTSLEKIVGGTEHLIDILQVDDGQSNDHYSINVCNFGLDAVVCAYANKLKDAGKKNAYTKGVIRAIFIGRYNKIDVEIDGKKVTNGRVLLGTLANCHYVGGSYFTAPLAKNDDGLIDASVFKPMSLLKFSTMLNAYKSGTHLNPENREKIKKELCFAKTNQPIHVFSDKKFDIALDGEVISGTSFYVSIVPNAINFIIPAD